MKCDLIIKIQTISEISSWEAGRRILDPLFSEEKLKPQRIATFGEVMSKTGLNVETLEDCEAHWAMRL